MHKYERGNEVIFDYEHYFVTTDLHLNPIRITHNDFNAEMDERGRLRQMELGFCVRGNSVFTVHQPTLPEEQLTVEIEIDQNQSSTSLAQEMGSFNANQFAAAGYGHTAIFEQSFRNFFSFIGLSAASQVNQKESGRERTWPMLAEYRYNGDDLIFERTLKVPYPAEFIQEGIKSGVHIAYPAFFRHHGDDLFFTNNKGIYDIKRESFAFPGIVDPRDEVLMNFAWSQDDRFILYQFERTERVKGRKRTATNLFLGCYDIEKGKRVGEELLGSNQRVRAVEFRGDDAIVLYRGKEIYALKTYLFHL